MKVEDDNLEKICGGSVSASILNYFSTAIKTVYSIGQGMGGAIRRIATKNVCPL